MKWIFDNCKYGDMIRVKIGTVLHYGIYVSDDEVIQFGLPPVGRVLADSTGVEVCATDIDEFASGGFVEVAALDKKESKKRNSPQKTVELARSRLGESGYDALHNNCEHFVHSCVFGEHRSEQEERMRSKWLARPILDVYIARINNDCKDVTMPKERKDEIENTVSQSLKIQKRSTWALLETAVKHSFDYTLDELRFERMKNGKWVCDKVWFSIAHTGEHAIVAVSNSACGVDAESRSEFDGKWQGEALRTFTNSIVAKGERSDDDALTLWIKKESAYKMSGKGAFVPNRINTNKERYALREFQVAAVAVCGKHAAAVRFFSADGQAVSPVVSGSAV